MYNQEMVNKIYDLGQKAYVEVQVNGVAINNLSLKELEEYFKAQKHFDVVSKECLSIFEKFQTENLI